MRHPVAAQSALVRIGGVFCRHSAILSTLAVSLAAAHADESARDIVLNALDVSSRESKAEKQYAYVEHTVESKLDSANAVKSRESKTWDVVQLEGAQFRRLIQHNDKPLTPKEEAEEKSRQQKMAHCCPKQVVTE